MPAVAILSRDNNQWKEALEVRKKDLQGGTANPKAAA